jgi:AraC-like DNA-binding protein
MTEIAYEIGYSNISAFSNNFQQLTHMRPTDFKTISKSLDLNTSYIYDYFALLTSVRAFRKQ